MPFLKIQYRDYPKEGLFKNLYRENIYKIEEFKDEFKYYEYTPIEKIIIDEHNLVPFIFFSPEGINYLMPKIIDSISNGIRNDDIPVNIEEFIINIPTAENIIHALNLLKKDELIILKKYLEKILFGDSSNLIQQIGEHYLFRSIDYLEKLNRKNSKKGKVLEMHKLKILNETPLDFQEKNIFDKWEVSYLDLMEVNQGSPLVGSLSINGHVIIKEQGFGGPLLYFDRKVYIPVFIRRFLVVGFRLATLNLDDLSIEYIGGIEDLVYLKEIKDNRIYFYTDIYKSTEKNLTLY